MSYKGQDIEDKSQEPLPRSLTSLIAIMAEVEAALGRKDKAALEGLLPDFASARKRGYQAQLEWSRVSGAAEVGVRFATELNKSMEVHGRAIALTSGLGARY
jgi:hypothetical protein